MAESTSDVPAPDAATDDESAASGSAGRPGGSTDAVEARLDDALERVAHGATVSVPSILLERGLTLAFTAILTNGFAAAAYGLFAVARRLQRFLLFVTLGFKGGLSRFLPNTDDAAERDAIVTVATALLLGVAVVLGAALALAAPAIARATDVGPGFAAYLRVFAVGLPATVFTFTVAETLRGLEEVGPLNVTQRVALPFALVGVALVGVFVVDDLLAVTAGVVATTGVVGVLAAVWLARERGLRMRFRGEGVPELRRRYFAYTVPLFLGGIATTTQRLGFYPLIAVFLSGVAGGVFAVGVLLGSLVRLPLMGINQFIPPVAAALHEEDHREALSRLYHVTSRLVLVGVTALAVPLVVFRRPVMGLFGPTFVQYAPLLPGFVLAQYGACAAGSVGILLAMTDNQRALLVVNAAITAFLAVTAVPLTVEFGLPGLVASYLLMLTVNNGLEVAVLYYLEGLQPFTRLHTRPLLAGVPLAVVALLARATLPSTQGAVVGTLGGLAAYALVLRWFGLTPVERRLVATLGERYRAVLPGSG